MPTTVTVGARTLGADAFTPFSTGPFRVCNGTLVCTDQPVTLGYQQGELFDLQVGQSLDVTGQDLSTLVFKNATAGSQGALSFFGSVHTGGS